MPRALWKGAISFGLVHIPVALYPASVASRLDLDLLDKRDFAPVGYERVNRKTGKKVKAEDIVKGYEYGKGQYVVVTDQDFRQANVEATQTIGILAFVDALTVAPWHFDTPYYLAPERRGEKGYALLRETLRRTGRIGIATVVIRTRQHLAALIPVGEVLLLDTLRFADEIRDAAGLKLPGQDLKKLGVTAKEAQMAAQLVEDMTERWKPEQYRDTYRADLLKRIEHRIETGQTHALSMPEEGKPDKRAGAEVIDLMELLQRSLDSKRQADTPRRKPARTRKARVSAKPKMRTA